MAIALVAVFRCSFRRGTDVSPSLAAGLFLHPGQGRSRDPARPFVRGVKRPVGLHAIEDRGRASQGEFQRPFHKFAMHALPALLVDVPLGCFAPAIDDDGVGRGDLFHHQDMRQDPVPYPGPLPGKGCELLGHCRIWGHKPELRRQ
jgi:hypothetical protein